MVEPICQNKINNQGLIPAFINTENKEVDVTNNHLHVTCAIIVQKGLVLAAQRSRSMAMPLKWEFPGGKIKPGETPKNCLLREIEEELCIKIIVNHAMPEMTHKYPTFTITLYPFVCSIRYGTIDLREHAAITWLPTEKLADLDWAEADMPVLKSYCRFIEQLTL